MLARTPWLGFKCRKLSHGISFETPLSALTIKMMGTRQATEVSLGPPMSYYRARYYDPQTGRFFSEDQKIPGRNPDWSNLYEYVENSSINFTDPYGRFTVKPGVPYPSLQIQALLECIEFKTLLPLQVTSTSDSHDPKDPHSRGLAVDIHYPGPMATDSILCAAAGCGAGFAQDEAKNPSPNATGPHIHLQIPPGRTEVAATFQHPIVIVVSVRQELWRRKIMIGMPSALGLLFLLMASPTYGQSHEPSPVPPVPRHTLRSRNKQFCKAGSLSILNTAVLRMETASVLMTLSR